MRMVVRVLRPAVLAPEPAHGPPRANTPMVWRIDFVRAHRRPRLYAAAVWRLNLPMGSCRRTGRRLLPVVWMIGFICAHRRPGLCAAAGLRLFPGDRRAFTVLDSFGARAC